VRREAEALEAAARALEETAGLMKSQAELFERTIGTPRQPAAFAMAAVALDRGPRKRGGRGSSRWPRASQTGYLVGVTSTADIMPGLPGQDSGRAEACGRSRGAERGAADGSPREVDERTVRTGYR
jgi:hypothetical protein